MAIAVDPVILAAFGEPPEGLDLEERLVVNHNVAVCVSLGLAVAAVALRLYVRRLKGARLWFDDYAIIFSTFCCGGTVAITVLAGQYGAGEHVWATNIPRLVNLLKVIYAEGYVYGLAVTATKISILLFYRRLLYSSPSPRSLFSILYWVAFFLATSYPVILWVIMATACRPISFYWNQYAGAEGQCINIKSFLLALGIINMLNDIMILTVPIPRILELQLSKKLKASTIGIMLLGGFVCIASIVRIYYIYQFSRKIDATWWMGPTMAWSSIEPSIAIVSACLPTFAPLFRFNRPHRSGSNPYYISDKTVASRKGTQVATVEDDEVELTCKVVARDAASSQGSDSKRNSTEERGIVPNTVDTVVGVSFY
ncbi:hypothetical protein BKA56DRAFT_732660 [Ilyonectria sp. MPI-CAGE-AT-0026]|nr:hypothetical protein BKA56DRAFT_732660 [Ilyonectria sp. MPI-CAGE-AT-0026]